METMIIVYYNAISADWAVIMGYIIITYAINKLYNIKTVDCYCMKNKINLLNYSCFSRILAESQPKKIYG